ncbi:hemolysin family protein [Hoeflea poritis]|uniref:Hemolysin family protein n=1 Tax=Hoeflea poritis TaxID=2993659 RepID=A0ABT4VNL1_9HYPH|nr:hemolysin family protein [Hoeflea poritis]MDA4846302.1 hemolysin family protein [Hoeflea poritis]
MSEQSSNAAPVDGSTGTQDSDGGEDPGSRQLPVVVKQTERNGHSWWSRLLRLFRNSDEHSLREDLTDALSADGVFGAAFTPEERAMLHNILRLREVRVEDVMVPRADIRAVDCGIALDELMALFEESGHSRMPVYGDTLDDPRGMVHIRDLVAHITRQARNKRRSSRNGAAAKSANGNGVAKKEKPAKPVQFDLTRVDLSKTVDEAGIIRDVLFVPPSMLATDLMQRMQAMRTQMALVIDEYGGTDGLVSLEDIVEMVVGDIEDEHDDEADMISQVSEDVFVADARVELEDIVDMIGGDFDVGDKAEDVDTLGGLIFSAIGRIPARGEVVRAIPQFEFHVLDADPRRIKRVRIVRRRMVERRRRPSRSEPEQPAPEKEAAKSPEPAGGDAP